MKKRTVFFVTALLSIGEMVAAQTTFSDDFEDGDFSDWTSVQGSWQIATPGFGSDFCLGSTSDTLSVIFAPSNSWYGIYEVDYRIPQNWQDFIIYIQKTPVTAALEPWARYYAIGLHPRGGDSNDYIKKVINGESTDLFVHSTSDSNLTEANTWARARIERLSGGEINVYVNGKLHMSVMDNAIASQGALLVGGWQTMFFDNLSYVVSSHPGKSNLLLNPGFELYADTSAVADYWSFGPGHESSVSRSSEARTGKYSQRMDIGTILPPAMLNYVVLTQSQEFLQLQARRTYRFGFWAKGRGRIAPSVILNGYNHVKWGEISTLTPSWHRFELAFTTPDTVASIEELIRCDDNTNFGGPIESDDWVLVDDAYLEGPLVEIEGMAVAPAYGRPGGSVAISASLRDVGRGILSVQAEVQSPDEIAHATIELFDDGAHGDGAPDDNIFASTWTTLATPMNFFVDIVVTEGNLDTTEFDNAAVFSTIDTSQPRQLTTDPGSDSNASILQTADGRILLFWNSARPSSAIWYKSSSDGGMTWSDDEQITTSEQGLSPSAVQSSDGRIWVFYQDFASADISYVTSTDGGNTWSSALSFAADPAADTGPNVAADGNGRMAVVWASTRSGNFDVFCRLSLDNGNSWADPTQITTDLSPDREPAVAIDGDGNVHVVWAQRDEILYSRSNSNGGSWLAPRGLTLGFGERAVYPAIDVDASGKLWVVFNAYGFYEKDRTDFNWEVYYTASVDGVNWPSFHRVTRFVGYDALPDVAIINDEPWVVWHSLRTVDYDIWAGSLTYIQDSNPPPYVWSVAHAPLSPAPTPNDVISIRTRVADESAVERVRLIHIVDDQVQPGLAMYDDGHHNDNAAADGVWGVDIGPYPAGTVIRYQIEARDLAGNVVVSPRFSREVNVIGPFVQTSELLLVGDYTSQFSSRLFPFYTAALDTNGYSYDIWDCFLRGIPDSVTLRPYQRGAVIWVTPAGAGHVGQNAAQANLQKYLDSGGKLFITGQDIGSSLKDSDFYRDYLHARFVQDNTDIYALNGVEGDPISDGMAIFIVGGDGANNQFQPDEIEPIFPAVPMFIYDGSAGFPAVTQRAFAGKSEVRLTGEVDGAIPEFFGVGEPDFSRRLQVPLSIGATTSSGTGAIRVDTETYKVVYLAFGFEAIHRETDRAFLIYKIMNWLVPTIHEAGIAHVSPNNGNSLGSVRVTIWGWGFQPGASVMLSKSGYQDIVGTETVVAGSNRILTAFDLTGRTLGRWDVVVSNPDGRKSILREGFAVGEGHVNLWVDIIGRDQIRVGRKSQIWVAYGNDGNIGAVDVMLFVSISDGAVSIVELDTLTDGRWRNAQGSFQYDSFTIWGIWCPMLRPGEKNLFKISIIPEFGHERITISSNFVRYLPLQATAQNDLIQIAHDSGHQPPFSLPGSITDRRAAQFQNYLLHRQFTVAETGKGAIIYVGPDSTNLFGHTALFAGDNKVYDLWLHNEYLQLDDSDPLKERLKMPMDYEEWRGLLTAHGAVVFDPVEPEGLNDNDRDEIVSAYKELIDDNVMFNLMGGKDRERGMSCVGAVEYCYEHGANINLVNIPDDPDNPSFGVGGTNESLLTPGLQYMVLSGTGDFYTTAEDYQGDFKGIGVPISVSQLQEWDETRAKLNLALEDPQSRKEPSVVSSMDPNEKSSLQGIGVHRSVLISRNLEYTIFFENVDSATAAAEEVLLSDTLTALYDLSTFRFGEIQFGDRIIALPGNQHHFTATIDLRPGIEALVQAECRFDVLTGVLSWYLRGTDPVTGDFAGFLPPNKKPPEGEGHVTFTAKPRRDLLSGTRLENRASIVFDVNPPMVTNTVANTIDALPPASRVIEALATANPLEYEVRWEGADDSLGSGLRNLTVYVSEDGGPYATWLANTVGASATFTAEPGRIYRFYSIARDSVGNTESQPDSFDVMLSLVTSVDADNPSAMPARFSLFQNYPNPFNPETTIRYQLPKTAKVVLEIYNVLGQKVRTLVDEEKTAGYYKVVWDGRSNTGVPVSSGVYFCRLKAADFTAVKKAVILR